MADNLGLNGLVVSAGKCAGPIPAAIGAAHFPAAFGMLLSQHPKEGAPFLGTALDEYKQSIEPAVSCHFHLLLYPYLFAK